MVGNKTFLLAIILLCLCQCTNDATKKVQGEFLCVTDSKPYTDSIYAERLKEGYAINKRVIELQYIIHNYTNDEIYLPIRTWTDSTANSFINVFFIDKKDTIYPVSYIKKVPFDSNFIIKGDSMRILIEIRDFEKWSKKGVDLDTSVDSLINRIHLEYHISSEDEREEYDIPEIEFGRLPQFYYEIPRDLSILISNNVASDRVLVRVGRQKPK